MICISIGIHFAKHKLHRFQKSMIESEIVFTFPVPPEAACVIFQALFLKAYSKKQAEQTYKSE